MIHESESHVLDGRSQSTFVQLAFQVGSENMGSCNIAMLFHGPCSLYDFVIILTSCYSYFEIQPFVLSTFELK